MKGKIYLLALIAVLSFGPVIASPTPFVKQTQTQSQPDYEVFITGVMPETERMDVIEMYRLIPETNRGPFLTMLRTAKPEVARALLRGFVVINRNGRTATVVPTTMLTDQQAWDLVLTSVPADDKPVLETYWTDLAPENRTTIVTLVQDANTGGFGQAPPTTTTPPTISQDPQVVVTNIMPESERTAAVEMIQLIPEMNRSTFLTTVQGMSPELARAVIRGFVSLNKSGRMNTDTTVTLTDQAAWDLMMATATPEDRTLLESYWSTAPSTDKTMFVTLIQDANQGGLGTTAPVTTPPETTTPPTTTPDTTTTTTTTGSMGSREMVFAMPLPVTEEAREAYMNVMNGFSPVEMNYEYALLKKFSPEQAATIVKALNAANDMGMSGNKQFGPSFGEGEVMKMVRDSLGSDQSTFETLWGNLSADERIMFVIMMRDAYNGGLADEGTTATGH